MWLSLLWGRIKHLKILILIFTASFHFCFGLNTKCKILLLTASLSFKCATVTKTKPMPCIRRCSCTMHYTCSRIKCDEKTITSNLLPFICFSCPAQVPPKASMNLNSTGSETCRWEAATYSLLECHCQTVQVPCLGEGMPVYEYLCFCFLKLEYLKL